MARTFRRPGQPAPECLDANLVCDREDLGSALRWMIRTAGHRVKPGEKPPPQTEAELAAKLGVSRQQVNKYVQGKGITSLRWDEILDALRIEGPERGSWATAYDRVQHHSKKCQQGYPQPCSSNEAESPDAATTPPQPGVAQRDVSPSIDPIKGSTTRRRSVHALIGVVGVALAVLIATVVVTTRSVPTTGPEAFPARVPALEPGTPCAAGGNGFSIENHHSGMVINNLDLPRMGLARSTTSVLVSYSPPDEVGGGCMITFRSNPGENRISCLEVFDAGGREPEIVWRPCRGELNQKWSSEKHWNDGKVVWERFHSSRDSRLCLQQAFSGGVGTPLTAKACDSNWLQQWKVVRQDH